jgi:hypothetical protein
MSDPVDSLPEPPPASDLSEWAEKEFERYMFMLCKPNPKIPVELDAPDLQQMVGMSSFYTSAVFHKVADVTSVPRPDYRFVICDKNYTGLYSVRAILKRKMEFKVTRIQMDNHEQLVEQFKEGVFYVQQEHVFAQIGDSDMDMFKHCTSVEVDEYDMSIRYYFSLDDWIDKALSFVQDSSDVHAKAQQALMDMLVIFTTPAPFQGRGLDQIRASELEPLRLATVGGATWHMYPPDNIGGSVMLESPTVYIIPQYNKQVRKYGYVSSASSETGPQAHRRFDLGVGDKVLDIVNFSSHDEMAYEMYDLIRNQGRPAMVYQSEALRFLDSYVEDLTRGVVPLISHKNGKPFYSISWEYFSENYVEQ